MYRKLYLTLIIALLGLSQCSENKVKLKGDRQSLLEASDALKKDPDADSFNVALPQPIALKSWPQTGGTASHVPPHAQLGDDLKVVWSQSIGSGSSREQALLASPIVCDEKVYTIDSRGLVQARHIENGKLLWEKKTEPTSKGNYHSGGGIAASQDKVYVVTPYGDVFAFHKESGFEIWKSSLPLPSRSAPTTDGERVYVTTTNNHTVCFDAVTGEKLWDHEGTAEISSLVGGAAPAVYRRVVLAPYSSGELFALRAENGQNLWSETLSSLRTLSSTSMLSQLCARPVVFDGMVIALSKADRMMALDFRSGQRIWDKEIGGTHTPAVTDGFIFVLTNDNQIACLLRDTGHVVWIQDLPKPKKGTNRWAGPVLGGGSLILSGSNKTALFLDPENGSIKKHLTLPDPVDLSPVIGEDTLLFLTRTGKLVAVR